MCVSVIIIWDRDPCHILTSPCVHHHFSSGTFLCVFTADCLCGQEVHDEVCSLSGPLQRHGMTAVLQQVHLAIWQRFLQHRCPGNVQHLMVDTFISNKRDHMTIT